MKRKITYFKLSKSFAPEIAAFVVRQNYQHHRDNINPSLVEKEIAQLSDHNQKVKFSKTFVAVHEQKICGSIRIHKKTKGVVLPIEKLFGIDTKKSVTPDCTIYHIGSFAIAKGADENGFRIFKTLMALALNEVTSSENNVVFAECDSKLLRTLKIVNIHPEIIGIPIEYLGSETIPVLLRRSGFIKFMDQNQHLVQHHLSYLRN